MMIQDGSLAPYNAQDAGNGRWVGIYDCTLRDGEQAAGVVFDRHDKLELARLLDGLGVDRIEVGMPVVSKEDAAAAADIVQAGLKAELWGFCRCVPGDVDACIEAGLKNLILEAPTSNFKMQAYNLVPTQVLERVKRTVNYARSKGARVAFFAVDATRSEERVLRETLEMAFQAGAMELVLADTLSVATPNTIAALTCRMRQWTGLPVMVHCHNDFGLATACTLAGVQAGASYVHVTINGLGEKAGNTDLAEIAFALKVLLGYDHHLKLEQLQQVAQTCARLSRFPLAPQKPVVGERAFARESGVVISQLNTYPPSVEAYDPQLVGRETQIVLGKKSGKSSIEYMMKKLGAPSMSEDESAQLLEAIKTLSLQKKGAVEESEFRSLLDKIRERQSL